ncbi:MAG TPA: hypothetical protein VG410_06705 [Solirubrobacteraceae bacterium]|nr:hypothetical protein [Solirubrobacteraceae bacterium]
MSLATQQAEPGGADFELTSPPMGLRELLWSDYQMAIVERDESPARSRLLWPLRVLINPSLLFAFTVRLAQKGPRWLLYPLRIIQVMCFSSEIHSFHGEDPLQIGPGISFPHPIGIIIGPGTKIGAGVTIYNNTNIGTNRHVPRREVARSTPRLCDRCVIYAYSAVQGPFDIGPEGVVGLHVVLDEDVPGGALKTHRLLRLAGEWPGENRTYWHPASERA